jgi:hypothetical protein
MTRLCVLRWIDWADWPAREAAAGRRQARIDEAVEDLNPRRGGLHCYQLGRNLSSSLRPRLRHRPGG